MLSGNWATIEPDFAMSSTLIKSLRRRPTRRFVSLLAVFALLLAGFAQAAHFHKNDGGGGAETHLQCLLCLHADRWAGPPVLPQPHAPTASIGAHIVIWSSGIDGRQFAHRYDARGPPLS
jgi:hypothetical protein